MNASQESTREDAQRSILNRLKRAQGQLRGVIAAVEEGRSCREVVTQLSAVSSALDKAGFAIVASAMSHCVSDPDAATTDEGSAQPTLSLDELEKIFLMLS
ncbi:MAG TPA: metal-sensitive transcriptional regulator [Pseudoclavibacter sp.]|nr:metal-sensitive transcriptional regulator [Pseudoclavibacter sp.]